MQMNLALGLGLGTIPIGEIASGPTPPPTIAFTHFTNDTYDIGGVSKTYPECYAQSTSAGVGVTIGIVPGEGFVIDLGVAGTTGSATLNSTGELSTALDINLGCTGVFDITPVFTDPSNQVYLGASIYLPGPADQFEFFIKPNGGVVELIMKDLTNYPTVDVITIIPNVISAQTYRIAFSFKPDLALISVNGASPISQVPNVIKDFSTGYFQFYGGLFGAPPGSKLTIGDADFYSYIDDDATLQLLSTP